MENGVRKWARKNMLLLWPCAEAWTRNEEAWKRSGALKYTVTVECEVTSKSPGCETGFLQSILKLPASLALRPHGQAHGRWSNFCFALTRPSYVFV